MGMTGLPELLCGNNNKIDEIIIRNIFDDMKKGIRPAFGSPETRCGKCMFYGIICPPSTEYIGCYGGWKREED